MDYQSNPQKQGMEGWKSVCVWNLTSVHVLDGSEGIERSEFSRVDKSQKAHARELFRGSGTNVEFLNRKVRKEDDFM